MSWASFLAKFGIKVGSKAGRKAAAKAGTGFWAKLGWKGGAVIGAGGIVGLQAVLGSSLPGLPGVPIWAWLLLGGGGILLISFRARAAPARRRR